MKTIQIIKFGMTFVSMNGEKLDDDMNKNMTISFGEDPLDEAFKAVFGGKLDVDEIEILDVKREETENELSYKVHLINKNINGSDNEGYCVITVKDKDIKEIKVAE